MTPPVNKQKSKKSEKPERPANIPVICNKCLTIVMRKNKDPRGAECHPCKMIRRNWNAKLYYTTHKRSGI